MDKIDAPRKAERFRCAKCAVNHYVDCDHTEFQYVYASEYEALERELSASQERVRELEADANRYRWLHQFDGWSWTKPPLRAITFSWFIKCDKEEIDAVIDAALKGKS